MGRMGEFQEDYGKFKDYSLPTTKPFSSHPYYKEKEWSLQKEIFKKLKKVAELLRSLHSNLTDESSKNTKSTIEKNHKILIKDLELMQSDMQNDPYAFNTKKLDTNEHRIDEMKAVCDTLQKVTSDENEFKKFSKIKHALNELEHLLQQPSPESDLEKAAQAITKPIETSEEKESVQVKAKKKVKEKSAAAPKKKKAAAKKAKPATKLLKPKKAASKKTQKPKAAAPKRKRAAKKVTKSKAKSVIKTKKAAPAKSKSKTKPAKTKKASTAKAKSKAKPAKTKKSAPAKSKSKTKTAKVKKAVTAKSRSKVKSSAARKRK